MKTYGLDFNDTTLNEKIAILNDMGVDFSDSEDVWSEQINHLIKIGLIILPTKTKEAQSKFMLNRKNELYRIDKEIDTYNNLNIDPSYVIDQQIRTVKIDIIKLSSGNIRDEYLCSNLDEYNNKLVSLEMQKSNLKTININYDNEIWGLKQEREAALKVPNLNHNMIFGDLDKFKKISSMINFNDPNLEKNINILLDSGFSFTDNNWSSKLNGLKDLIPKNPIIQWQTSILKLVSEVVMLPMRLIMGLFEKLITLITGIINIPLNPTKIPKWSIEIIKKFNNFISLIVKLPTLTGMQDFLIMSADGLKLVDVYLPGFSSFIKLVDSKTFSLRKDIIIITKQITSLSKQLSILKKNINVINNKISYFSTENINTLSIQKKY
jgi:hypothetical protein